MNDPMLELAKLALPWEWLTYFDVEWVEVIDKLKEIKISLVEKNDLIPKELLKRVKWDKSKVSLNWYCRPVEIIDFPLRENSTYLIFKRRQWKQSWLDRDHEDYKSYVNEYSLHFEWMKTTKKFWLFLKELTWEELDEFLSTFPSYKHPLKDNLQMVQGCLKLI